MDQFFMTTPPFLSLPASLLGDDVGRMIEYDTVHSQNRNINQQRGGGGLDTLSANRPCHLMHGVCLPYTHLLLATANINLVIVRRRRLHRYGFS